MNYYDEMRKGGKRYMRAVRQDRRRKRDEERTANEIEDWLRPLPDMQRSLFTVKSGGRLYYSFYDHAAFILTRLDKGAKDYGNAGKQVFVFGSSYPLTRIAYWFWAGYDPGGDNFEQTLGVSLVDRSRQEDMSADNLILTAELFRNVRMHRKRRNLTMNELTAGERILKRVRQTNVSSVAKFRESMAIMGMVQMNVFVPEDGKEEVSLVADKVRAYGMLKLCDLPVSDRRRQLLADRNHYAIPTYERIKELEDVIKARGLPLMGDLRALRESVGSSLTARGALQHTSGDDEEIFKFSSIAVAHSAIAKYHYDYIMWSLRQ